MTVTLGGEVEVPTMTGKAKFTVQESTQSGKIFRLKGKGFKALRGSGVGDLLCRVIVETPVKLDESQKEHLKQFDQMLEEDNKDHRPKTKNWFDSVKDFFN